MSESCPRSSLAACLAPCIAILLTAMPSARAAVISATPTLPVLGAPYASPTGAGCFPVAGVCISLGTLTPVSLVSSTFDADSQNIVANVVYSGLLTTLANSPLGPISLTGTMEQEVLGRTFATELGTWETELVALSLSGPVLGRTLTLMLDASTPSTGETSIEPSGSGGGEQFRIDSFFDVFVELSLDTTPPLVTTRGPIRASLVALPEPGTAALLGLGLAGLAWQRWRRM
jgi:hypothetical protein